MKKILYLAPVILTGCSEEQKVAIAQKVAEVAAVVAPIAAVPNPLIGLAVKGLAGAAGLYITYLTGIHRPILTAAGSVVGHAGDIVTGTSDVASEGIGGFIQHTEELLKKLGAPKA